VPFAVVTPYHTTVGPACACATAATAANGIPPAACAELPFCIINAAPITHSPTPHSVTAPAIAFLLIGSSPIRFEVQSPPATPNDPRQIDSVPVHQPHPNELLQPCRNARGRVVILREIARLRT
jgi:Tfp pilus assembly protein FimV